MENGVELEKKNTGKRETAAAEGGVTGVHKASAWVDPILRAKLSRGERKKVETLECLLKALLPCFPLSRIFVPRVSRFPIFFVLQLNPIFHYTISPFLVFDSLTVFRQRGTKNTVSDWISSTTA